MYDKAGYEANKEKHAAANHSYYMRNKARVNARSRRWNAANGHKNRARYYVFQVDLRALRLLRGCVDCGYDAHADALQFDHIAGQKKNNIVSTHPYGKSFLAEIAKCEVRCANCHALVTAQRRKGVN